MLAVAWRWVEALVPESKARNLKSHAARAQRHAEAVQLRLAGVSLAAIADRLGYANESGAYYAVMAALAKARREPAEQLRELATQRLDRMLQAVWPRVLVGDLDAIGTALRIEQRRAALLGLDQAAKVDLTVI